MQYWLIMPAAGAGRRFGGAGPKQHAPLADSTLLEVALRPFLADTRCVGGALVMAAGDNQRHALRRRLPPLFRFADGGVERSHSVLNGLDALAHRAAEGDWVLVHDAARPCLSGHDLDHLLESLAAHTTGGLLAAKVADTVKQAGTDGAAGAAGLAICMATLPREGLWLAQTPQMFRYGALRHALHSALTAGRIPTDEAQAMEWQGAKPVLIASRDCNLKVTCAADLALAAAVLAARV
jgi:2-C-methyl-D-erythritol 4-phosphate cytidylyltransferase